MNLQKIYDTTLDLGGVYYNGEKIFTKSQVSILLDIDERTIERYLSSNEKELSVNGYRVIRGIELREIKCMFGTDIDVATKTTICGLDGIREIGLLDSVLAHIQNDDYYPSFEEKLHHLVFE